MCLSDPSPFPFLSLPIELQERILSLLPVSDLLPLLSVSHSIRSLIQSPTFPSPPPDLFFLLFSSIDPPFPKLLSYHPASHRWVSLPISSHSPLYHSRPYATSSSLAITLSSPAGPDYEDEDVPPEASLAAMRMFSSLPHQEIPPMIPLGYCFVYAVIPDGDVSLSGPSDHFRILGHSYFNHGIFSQVYDSRLGRWSLTGKIPCQTALCTNTAFVNRSLYVSDFMPYQCQLLKFDLTSYTWEIILPMPEMILSASIFSHDQNVYLVAGFEDEPGRIITAIRVLILDWGENHESREWKETSILSGTEEAFVGFTNGACWLYGFETVARNGLVCLHSPYTSRVLLFDVRDRSWVLLPRSSLEPEYTMWYGHATEMGQEVLRPVGA
ncbi:F-box domain containing protein [Rhynchospora pubera]|uniref:F-box domain containing protein n=1 Tax=Rhynchospora pubera TaxID=906938 RepID=A0AAV8EHA8_9POAL|nr:F-box domain containing protein [Rhynchospora pubera]